MARLHPMEVKKNLARTITAGFHGVQAAEAAARELVDAVSAEGRG